jgi:hypothetical protein
MNLRREKWFRYFIYWWLLAFTWAAVIQGFFPEMVASHTGWGSATGWQHEIAIWNIGMICVLVGILLSKIPLGKTVIPGLCILFTLLGLNHLMAALGDPDRHGYTIVILNFVPVLAVGLVLFLTNEHASDS